LCTALGTTRSRVATAAAPQASGTLDPAFDAHVMPLKHWATAWWEGWNDEPSLDFRLLGYSWRAQAILFGAWSLVPPLP
jgi:hypothetical protein